MCLYVSVYNVNLYKEHDKTQNQRNKKKNQKLNRHNLQCSASNKRLHNCTATTYCRQFYIVYTIHSQCNENVKLFCALGVNEIIE